MPSQWRFIKCPLVRDDWSNRWKLVDSNKSTVFLSTKVGVFQPSTLLVHAFSVTLGFDCFFVVVFFVFFCFLACFFVVVFFFLLVYLFACLFVCLFLLFPVVLLERSRTQMSFIIYNDNHHGYPKTSLCISVKYTQTVPGSETWPFKKRNKKLVRSKW